MQIVLTWIAEALISALGDLLVLGIGYGIARVMLPLLSFGRIQVEPLRGSAMKFNLLGYRRAAGRIEIAATTAGILGCVIGLFAVFALVVLVRTAA
jgi:hypothetical protein